LALAVPPSLGILDTTAMEPECYAKNSDAKHMESQVLRANPGFSQSTYGIAINDGFVILR
jgi:hypothetical protein